MGTLKGLIFFPLTCGNQAFPVLPAVTHINKVAPTSAYIPWHGLEGNFQSYRLPDKHGSAGKPSTTTYMGSAQVIPIP